MVLTWVALAVSGPALLFHTAAIAHHVLDNRASAAPEKITGSGYARAAGWRAAVALAYLAAASVQAADVRLPGGGLSAESLLMFVGTQIAGLANSLLDVPLRHRAARALRGLPCRHPANSTTRAPKRLLPDPDGGTGG